MKLYHFCGEKFLPGILLEGLKYGVIPYIDNGKLAKLRPYQWLTLNSSFTQEWERYSSLPYRRNDYRITIELDENDAKLHKWLDFCRQDHLKLIAKYLNSHGDPENWYVYSGYIDKENFKGLEPNPEKHIFGLPYFQNYKEKKIETD